MKVRMKGKATLVPKQLAMKAYEGVKIKLHVV